MADDLFQFVCRAPTHGFTEREKTGSATPVTTHQAKWAYCPAGASTGHDWQTVTPVSFADLRRAGLAKS